MIVPLQYSTKKKTIFGSGKFIELQEHIRKIPDLTAVFVNVDMLAAAQHTELYEAWKVHVFDR